MDKRKLSAIPRGTATEDMFLEAQRLERGHIITAELVEDKKILLLTFYEVSSLKDKQAGAAFRTFLSEDDYITQDLTCQKTKWLTGSFIRMDFFEVVSTRWNYGSHKNEVELLARFRSEEELKLVIDFFKDYPSESKYLPDPWNRINDYQDRVLNKRLDERHRKELAPVDRAMEPIKEAPEAFKEWALDEGMSKYRYLIYKAVSKNMAKCECTYCKQSGEVSRLEHSLKNNKEGICPFCGTHVTIKAAGLMASNHCDSRWFIYIDPYKDGFAIRYFEAFRRVKSCKDYPIGSVKRTEDSIYEFCRDIYRFNDGKASLNAYEWGAYKGRGEARWIPNDYHYSCMMCGLYTKNLPLAWQHTPLKYSAIELLAKVNKNLRYEDVINLYLKHPKLEWLIKMGFSELVSDMVLIPYRVSLDFDKKTIYSILGLNKENLKIFQEINGDFEVLKLMRLFERRGIRVVKEQFLKFYDIFGNNSLLVREANKKVSLHKIMKYIERESKMYPLVKRIDRSDEDPEQLEKNRMCNMAMDWLNYLDWCKELKYDCSDMWIYMPNNFKQVHDRVSKEYTALKDRIEAEERAKKELMAKKCMIESAEAISKIFKQADGSNTFSVKGKNLILRVPKNANEIKMEGEILHHCVATYIDKVAEGKTMIFFIREADKPDEPFYTLEWKDNEVVQCRGSHNKGMTTEVKQFVEAFTNKMLKAIEKIREKENDREKQNIQSEKRVGAA